MPPAALLLCSQLCLCFPTHYSYREDTRSITCRNPVFMKTCQEQCHGADGCLTPIATVAALEHHILGLYTEAEAKWGKSLILNQEETRLCSRPAPVTVSMLRHSAALCTINNSPQRPFLDSEAKWVSVCNLHCEVFSVPKTEWINVQPAVPDVAGFSTSLSTHAAVVMFPQRWVCKQGGGRSSALSHGAGWDSASFCFCNHNLKSLQGEGMARQRHGFSWLHLQMFKRCLGHAALSSIRAWGQGKNVPNPPAPTHTANGPSRKSCSCSQAFYSQHFQMAERTEKPKRGKCMSHNHGWWHFNW